MISPTPSTPEKWLTSRNVIELKIDKELIPLAFLTYTASSSGKRFYVVGLSTKVRRANNPPRVFREPCLLVADLVTKEVVNYQLVIDEEFNDQVIEFYILSQDEAVLLAYDHDNEMLVLHRITIDKERRRAVSTCERRVFFDAPEGLRVGIGAVAQGYIVVVGRTSRVMGDICKAKLLAADPLNIGVLTEFNLEDDIMFLEREAQMHPEELYIWPKSVPILYQESIFFLMAKKRGFRLFFDTAHLGVLEFRKKEKRFVPRVQDVDDSSMKDQELNVNYGCMIAQKNSALWLSFVSPAPLSHWRWKLQLFLGIGCHFLLYFVGNFSLWMGQFDGGLFAFNFMKFYIWLAGPSLVPDVRPTPTLRLITLDMDKFKFDAWRFKVDGSSLKGFGQVLVDCTPEGEAVVCEMPAEGDRARVHRIPRPRYPRRLEKIVKEKCEDVWPRMFLQKRLPPHLAASKSSLFCCPTWDLRIHTEC